MTTTSRATPEEEDAIRFAQVIAGGIGHLPDPGRHAEGMERLADRVIGPARAALVGRVGAWQGNLIVNDYFAGDTCEEIGRRLDVHKGTVSKWGNGRKPSLENIVEAKWLSGEWGEIDLPPRWDVNAAIVNAVVQALSPALRQADWPDCVPDRGFVAQEVELLITLHEHAETFGREQALARATGRCDRTTSDQFVVGLRRHLSRVFGDNLPKRPLFGFGPTAGVFAALGPFFADWTPILQWVNELLDRREFTPHIEPAGELLALRRRG